MSLWRSKDYNVIKTIEVRRVTTGARLQVLYKSKEAVSKVDILFLGKKEIEELVSMDEAIEVIEEMFKDFGNGQVVCPPKLVMDLRLHGIEGWINSMPAYLKKAGVAGTKSVNVHYTNAVKKLPTTMGVVILNDPETGRPFAVMDGMFVTHIRTGAASAVAVKYLNKKDACVVSIIGAGAEGRNNYHAVSRVMDVKKVKVYDIVSSASENFKNHVGSGIEVQICHTPEECAKGADVLLICTTAKEPVIDLEDVDAGTLIVEIGGFTDLDASAVTKADKFIVDEKECALKRISQVAGYKLESGQVYAEVGDIVVGRKAGRSSDQEVILYAPVGMGAEDVAVAYYAYKKAMKLGKGTTLELF